ncbi:hypothetical protein MHIB_25120 [Mycolicibacter hiberniae]|uniref:Uncharacterized protein n=1 Tax=Mycolicibacter hiberniae TaxID=29314 RepID=A0A7I7X3B3_9MYCO|nr:hypothetical protein MHIB_25120 [Mycolicibacter hiberniae]
MRLSQVSDGGGACGGDAESTVFKAGMGIAPSVKSHTVDRVDASYTFTDEMQGGSLPGERG